MSDKGFSDDEVREAHSRAVRLAELTDVATPWKELIWAASEYLKAKTVIEWYVDCKCEIDNAKAREYLDSLKKGK